MLRGDRVKESRNIHKRNDYWLCLPHLRIKSVRPNYENQEKDIKTKRRTTFGEVPNWTQGEMIRRRDQMKSELTTTKGMTDYTRVKMNT